MLLFLIARDVIGALTNAWMLYFGLLFIAVVLFRPEGIAGAVTAAFQNCSLNATGKLGDAAAVRRRTMALIEAAGVHVRFGDRVVLESIDLAVGEGEFHGLMGPNGAGKTTFFNVLTGRVKPSRGSIRLDGEDVTGLSSHRIAAKGIARSFQIMTLFDDFSARENVMVGLPGFSRPRFRHAPCGRRRSRL